MAKHVYRLEFDPASRRLAAVGPNTLTLCAFGEGTPALCHFSLPPRSVPEFDARGTLYTCNGTALCRWNADETWTPVTVAAPDKPMPNAVQTQIAFEPGGRFAVSDVTAIRVYGPTGGGELGSVSCTTSVTGLAFGPGDLLAAGCGDRKVRVWDARTFGLRRTMDTGPEQPRSLAVTRDGRWLACGCGSVVKLWCLADEMGRMDLVGHRGAVKSVAFSADGRTLASGGADGTVRLWQVETGSEMLVLSEGGAVDCLAFSPCGGVLAFGGPPSATEPSQLFLRGARRGPP